MAMFVLIIFCPHGSRVFRVFVQVRLLCAPNANFLCGFRIIFYVLSYNLLNQCVVNELVSYSARTACVVFISVCQRILLS